MKNNWGCWINIKMSSYQYRKFHCGYKTILRPSYLHNEISYTGKTISLCWIRAQVCCLVITYKTLLSKPLNHWSPHYLRDACSLCWVELAVVCVCFVWWGQLACIEIGRLSCIQLIYKQNMSCIHYLMMCVTSPHELWTEIEIYSFYCNIFCNISNCLCHVSIENWLIIQLDCFAS